MYSFTDAGQRKHWRRRGHRPHLRRRDRRHERRRSHPHFRDRLSPPHQLFPHRLLRCRGRSRRCGGRLDSPRRRRPHPYHRRQRPWPRLRRPQLARIIHWTDQGRHCCGTELVYVDFCLSEFSTQKGRNSRTQRPVQSGPQDSISYKYQAACLVGCCLIVLHFRCQILPPHSVDQFGLPCATAVCRTSKSRIDTSPYGSERHSPASANGANHLSPPDPSWRRVHSDSALHQSVGGGGGGGGQQGRLLFPHMILSQLIASVRSLHLFT